MKMAGPNPPVELFTPDGIIYTYPRYLPGSRFLDVHITDSIICEGCRITKATIASSIVGIRGVVGPGATVERTVIMAADYMEEENTDSIPIGIGAGSTVVNAIVDKNARIGRNVVIRGSKKLKDSDHEGYAVRDGIIIVMKNARIPNSTRIE
jgi:glucose-1-phosphate adenylyltransferase